MGALGTWDIIIFISYLILALGIGWWSKSKASESLDQFFVAGRSMPGWLIGISMVATTFAADTPLVVSGIVNDKGIAGNWFWWSLALGIYSQPLSLHHCGDAPPSSLMLNLLNYVILAGLLSGYVG